MGCVFLGAPSARAIRYIPRRPGDIATIDGMFIHHFTKFAFDLPSGNELTA